MTRQQIETLRVNAFEAITLQMRQLEEKPLQGHAFFAYLRSLHDFHAACRRELDAMDSLTRRGNLLAFIGEILAMIREVEAGTGKPTFELDTFRLLLNAALAKEGAA